MKKEEYLGIFIVSAVSLALEVLLTRLFSLAYWHHFAFLIISMGMFGFGASGTLLTIKPELLNKNITKLSAALSLILGATILASTLSAKIIPFDPYLLNKPQQLLYLSTYYIILSLPFLCTGIIIGMYLSKYQSKAGTIYFSNLTGSGIGSLTPTLLLPILGNNTITLLAVIGAAASLLFTQKKHTLLAVLGIIILGLLLPTQFPISEYKPIMQLTKYPNATIIKTEWTPTTRIDVIKSKGIRSAPGLSITWTKPLPPQLGLTIDGGQQETIPLTNNSTAEYTKHTTPYILYHLRPQADTLIIEPKGGTEALTALTGGAENITIIEKNPLIAEILTSPLSNNLYKKPQIKVSVETPRSFLTKTKQEYDTIQLSLLHGSGPTGISSLSENYELTTQAFQQYHAHLKEDGILMINDWLVHPPREIIRFTTTLNQIIDELPQKMTIIRNWSTYTILVKKTPFTQQENEKIREFCREERFDLVHLSDLKKEEVNKYNQFTEPHYYNTVQEVLNNPKEFEDYVFNVNPVSDNKPYFYSFFNWKDLRTLITTMGKGWQPFIEGGYIILLFSLLQAIILSTLFILLPVYVIKNIEWNKSSLNTLSFFSLIALAYLFLEIVFIQKFILFLGEPTHSISLVLFSVLVFSGIGSYASGLWDKNKNKIMIGLLPVLIIIYSLILPFIFSNLSHLSIIHKFITSALLLAPVSFLMGFPFPTGLSLTKEKLLPWAWSVNSCVSVISSILAAILSFTFGFNTVLWTSAILYFISFLQITLLGLHQS